ncbi:PREDICTED: ATP-dependent DNA helicase II subunit 1-like isoform X2 [Dinoponera quadriceps]|nr:PREDICTED: ATP-dependent DNA helicase II subunit 1-like isoform X2 [Dinoponera quadriceps]XP_014477836.1 PREDICTED: ATP-dependent DNA helicase II subunit 1-like isoform X2 [Dinoponera quadriceps]
MQNQNMDEEEDFEMSQWYGVREATLFVVDATQKMFEEDPKNKISCIRKFFKLYKQILRQKLASNMQDWIGVVLFGTEQKDPDSCWKHIQTLQPLRVVTLDDLQHIRKLTKDNMRCYQSMQSDDTYPLYDVLSHSMDIFLKIKTVLTKRRIALITCHSPVLEEDEKYRIRSAAASLATRDIELYVISLDDNWVRDGFYKELEMLSRKTDPAVYRLTSMVDLVQQIQAPPKNIAQLSFKMCDNLELDLVVRTLGRKRRCLQMKQLSKATGQILSRSTYFKGDENFYDEENNDDEEADLPYLIPEEVNLETEREIGGRKLHFTPKEISRVKHIHPPAIKLIGVKPIPNDLFRYHVKRQYFVRPNNGSTRKDNLLFFGALLNKCAAAGKMIVCTFTMRVNTQTNLCYMIPNVELGGFYLSKVSFQGSIGDKSEVLDHYRTQQQVTNEEVELWKRTIDQLNMEYCPHKFKSYKLESQIQIVEKLALDKKPGPPPNNTIEQSFLKTYKEVAELVPEFKTMYPNLDKSDEPPKAKKARKTKATS